MKKHLFELIHGIGEDCVLEEYIQEEEDFKCQNR